MKEIICFIRPEKWLATREVVGALGIQETLQVRVLGRERQRGLHYLRRAAENVAPTAKEDDGGMQFLPKRMVGWLVPDDMVDRLVAAVIGVNQTDNFGDGKIFVCPLDGVSDEQDN